MQEIIEAEKSNQFKLGAQWADVLKKIDLDGDGKIDFHEFFTAAVDHQKVLTKKNLKAAFDIFDADGNGTIDVEEFKFALPSSKRKGTILSG